MYWNESAETLARPDLRALQLQRLRTTIADVYARVPLFHERCEAAGVGPDSLHHLEDLVRFPCTIKSDLRATYPFGLFARPLDQVVRLHASSGTRGKPTVVGYTRGDIALWAEVCARALVAAGARPGDRLHNAYGYGLFTGGLGLHYGAELLGCTVVPMSGGNTPRQVLLLQDFAAQILTCTPSYALNLADHLDNAGIAPGSLALRLGLFGAEPWTEAMRAQIERRLGIIALDLYGLSEIIGPGVAMECADGRDGLHVWEDHFLVEILDPATGAPLPEGVEGDLTFTSLSKEAFPLVRYRTGDLCRFTTEPCRCGRTHGRMSRIKGRTDDMLVIRGVNVFPSEIERVLLAQPELAPHYQIVVDRTATMPRLEVLTEMSATFAAADPSAEATAALCRRIESVLAAALSLHTAVRLHPPGSVPRSEGKAVRVVERPVGAGA